MKEPIPDSWPISDRELEVARRLIERDLARRILSELSADRFHAWRKESRMGQAALADEMIEEAVYFARFVAQRYAAQEV